MSVFAGRAVFPATFADPHGNGRAGLSIAVYRRLTYTDGVTVLGSKRLESATAAFTSDDEDKSISAENFPSGATIEAYVSATEVDLSVEATAGGSGASFIIAGRQRSADLATVYTDRLKSETTGNPYVADVDGNTFPYVDPGDYDAVTIHGVVPFSAAPDHEDVETVVAGLPAHLADAVDAHDASAISVVPAGSLAATTVQAALAELDAEKQPIDSDLTAIAALSTTAFGRGLLALADGAALAGSIPSGTFVDKTTAAPAVGERGKAKEEQGGAGVADEWYFIRKRKDDSYGTAPLLPRLIDIREWGIRGVGDETALFQEAVSDLPALIRSWGAAGTAWESHASIGFLFPSRMQLVLSSQILWPANTPVVMKSESPWGTRIEYTGADAAFSIAPGSVGSVFHVEGMVFWKAAFKFTGAFRGHVRFRDNNCIGSPVTQVDFGAGAAASGVTFGDVTNNNFYRCTGGVWQRVDTNQLMTIRKNRFNANRGIPVWIDSSGAHILDNDFQSVSAPEIPYIRLGGSRGMADVAIQINRFGNEEFTASEPYFPPEAYIVAHDETGSFPLAGVTVSDNEVRTAAAVSATMCHTFIRLKTRVAGWKLDGNKLGKFNGPIVEEKWIDETAAVAFGWSEYRGQHVDTAHTAKKFSHGGVAWKRYDRHEAPIAHTADQLFSTDDLTNAAWTKASTTVAQDITGPGGIRGYTVTRTVTAANSSVRRAVTTTRETPVTFSVLARAGTLDIMRLWMDVGGRFLIPQSDPLRLDNNWRLYHVTVPVVAAAATVTCWLLPGITAWPAGTIEVAAVRAVEAGTPGQSFPRLDLGVVPTASLPAAAATQDGRVLIEDAGAGDRNLVFYAGGQRFRIDGGAAV